MSKEKAKAPSVEELAEALKKESAEKAAVEAKLAEALKARAAEASAPAGKPDGVRYTKPAPKGEPGSDGKGNLIKYATNEKVEKLLEAEGWKKAA